MSGLTAMWLAVVPGDVVWSALAAVTAAWVAVTTRVPGLAGPAAVLEWVLASWAGRMIALTLWAAAGWHLFCQRP
jgi:hypothetical protein